MDCGKTKNKWFLLLYIPFLFTGSFPEIIRISLVKKCGMCAFLRNKWMGGQKEKILSLSGLNKIL